eukprot:Hpha_TRINITY_DN15713_c2_g6::TRINITY_DN15713_c2_g6_i1::g.40985::m.40985
MVGEVGAREGLKEGEVGLREGLRVVAAVGAPVGGGGGGGEGAVVAGTVGLLEGGDEGEVGLNDGPGVGEADGEAAPSLHPQRSTDTATATTRRILFYCFSPVCLGGWC